MSLPPCPISSDKRAENADTGPKSLRQGIATEVFRLPLILAIFGLAGPPIGGLVAWMTMGAPAMRSPVPFVGGSYGEGVVLALATGLIVAVGAWFGKSSWIVAVAGAIAANAVFHASSLWPDLSSPEHVAALLQVGGVFLPPSIAAAIICWLLVRPLLRIW